MSIIDTAKGLRKNEIQKASLHEWDYVVVGSGITGIQTFRVLSSKGFKVLLIDKADFVSGASSNSGMLIWGGLLYLKNMDFKSVFRFSKSRDHLISNDPENIKILSVAYVSDKRNLLTELGLWLYWVISLFRRTRPYNSYSSSEQALFDRKYKNVNIFEEALIQSSDARYSMDLLMMSLNKYKNSRAFNYLAVVKGEFLNSKWELMLDDEILSETIKVKANNLINCTGVYVGEVNKLLGIVTSPYRHLWSKGVYLNLVRKSTHNSMMIFDDPDKDDVLTYCPVGDVSFFGPTEDNIDNNRSAALKVTADDIAQLKNKYEICTGEKLSRSDVVSFRVGVRPLCVPTDFSDPGYTLSISRNSKAFHLSQKHFTAVYGGKFTGSYDLAVKAVKSFGVGDVCKEEAVIPYWKKENHKADHIDPETAVLREQCWTLKDYLRNRTFINQSVANGGFGLNFEFQEKIENLSACFLKVLASKNVSFDAYFEEQKELNELFKVEIDDK